MNNLFYVRTNAYDFLLAYDYEDGISKVFIDPERDVPRLKDESLKDYALRVIYDEVEDTSSWEEYEELTLQPDYLRSCDEVEIIAECERYGV